MVFIAYGYIELFVSRVKELMIVITLCFLCLQRVAGAPVDVSHSMYDMWMMLIASAIYLTTSLFLSFFIQFSNHISILRERSELPRTKDLYRDGVIPADALEYSFMTH